MIYEQIKKEIEKIQERQKEIAKLRYALDVEFVDNRKRMAKLTKEMKQYTPSLDLFKKK